MTAVEPAAQPVKHTCHASGCNAPVPPSRFMCKPHWYALPKALRDWIWATYRPGQETTKDPGREYLKAARACIDYIAWKQGVPSDTP